MKTPVGRWAIAPALIAALAIFAWGLILTLANLQNGLPQWVYGAPGIPSVLLYYWIELRKVWQKNIQPEINVQKDSKGVTKQTVKGGAIVPNIQGDNLVINQTIIQNHHAPPLRQEPPARSVAPTPQPLAVAPAKPSPPLPPPELPPPAPEPVKITLKEAPPAPQLMPPEILHDGLVKVSGADREMIEFLVRKGDRVQGSLFSDLPLFAWIWSERGLAENWGTRNVGKSLLCDDDASAVIDWKAPGSGRYYLILDTYGKQVVRNVMVRLEKVVTVTV